MKKIIGVTVILVTLVLTVIYRQMARPAKDKPSRTYVSRSLREGMVMSCLLLQ